MADRGPGPRSASCALDQLIGPIRLISDSAAAFAKQYVLGMQKRTRRRIADRHPGTSARPTKTTARLASTHHSTVGSQLRTLCRAGVLADDSSMVEDPALKPYSDARFMLEIKPVYCPGFSEVVVTALQPRCKSGDGEVR